MTASLKSCTSPARSRRNKATPSAHRRRTKASIAVRERLNDRAGIAAALSNLGVVAEYEGQYREALVFHGRALDLRHELGDRWAIAVSCTNVGMIAVHEERFVDAGMAFREAMRLALEVGDLWMVAICHNNLGNALRGIGDYDAAATNTRPRRQDVSTEYDDHWALAFLLEDVALLAAALGSGRSRRLSCSGAADRQRQDLGSPRAPALEATITSKLDAATGAILGRAQPGGARCTFETERALRPCCQFAQPRVHPKFDNERTDYWTGLGVTPIDALSTAREPAR